MVNIIRNNIGFFVFIAVGIILIGILSAWARTSRVAVQEVKEELQEQKAFFQKVRRMQVPLTEENVEKLAEKKEMASSTIAGTLQELRDRYYVAGDRKSAVKTKQAVKAAVEEMRDQLDENGVIVDSKAEGLSFSDQIQSRQLPAEDRIPSILKYVEIVRGVVDVVASSHVGKLTSMERLDGYDIEEEDLHNSASFRLEATASARRIRRLINKLHSSDKHLFIVRNVSIEATESQSGGDTRRGRRRDAEDPQERRDDGMRERDDGRRERDDGMRERDDGRRERDDGRRERDDGRREDDSADEKTGAVFDQPHLQANIQFEYIEFPPEEGTMSD